MNVNQIKDELYKEIAGCIAVNDNAATVSDVMQEIILANLRAVGRKSQTYMQEISRVRDYQAGRK